MVEGDELRPRSNNFVFTGACGIRLKVLEFRALFVRCLSHGLDIHCLQYHYGLNPYILSQSELFIVIGSLVFLKRTSAE